MVTISRRDSRSSKTTIAQVAFFQVKFLKSPKGFGNFHKLWMIFLDGDDLAFTQDHDLYRHISDLANSHPRCTIEEEVGHWMTMLAGQMTDFEIALALWCGVDRVGSILVINGNFDETLDELIQHRNSVNPAFWGK